MDWKIILILVALAGIILIICWYSCPPREDYNIPWRPDSDRYRAPNVGFTLPDGRPLRIPFTVCSDIKKLYIYWMCDYSTTIYKPELVHFNLATIANLPGGITTPLLPINNNISRSDPNIVVDDANKPIVHYTYTYNLGEEDSLKPGGYNLYLNSFIPQSENVPKGQKTDSDITEESMVVYDSKVKNVRDVKILVDDEETSWVYTTDDFTVKWKCVERDEPKPGINYIVTLKSANDGDPIIRSPPTTNLYITYKSGTLPIGVYMAMVQTNNFICDTSSDGASSNSFDVELEPLPIPVLKSANYCPNKDAGIVWTMDFNDTPFDPLTEDILYSVYIDTVYGECGQPLELVGKDENMPTDNTDDTNLTYTEEDNIYTYTYTIKQPINPGVYSFMVDVSYVNASPSQTYSQFNVYQYTDQSGLSTNVTVDKDTYTDGDIISASWDPPTDVCPVFTGYRYNICLLLGTTGSTCLGSHTGEPHTQCGTGKRQTYYFKIDSTVPIGDKDYWCKGGDSASNPDPQAIPPGTYRFGVKSNYTCGSTKGTWSAGESFTVT